MNNGDEPNELEEEMSNQNKSFLTMALDVATNPWVLAGVGGAAGYYFFGRKDGKTIEGKTPYIAAGVGAAAGLAAGKLIQHYRMQSAAPQLTAAAQQQAAQVRQQAAAQQQAESYYDMDSVEGQVDVDEVFQGAAQQTQQGVPLQVDIDQPIGLGSLDGSTIGGSGLGSFDRDVGFDAFDRSVDEAATEPN